MQCDKAGNERGTNKQVFAAAAAAGCLRAPLPQQLCEVGRSESCPGLGKRASTLKGLSGHGLINAANAATPAPRHAANCRRLARLLPLRSCAGRPRRSGKEAASMSPTGEGGEGQAISQGASFAPTAWAAPLPLRQTSRGPSWAWLAFSSAFSGTACRLREEAASPRGGRVEAGLCSGGRSSSRRRRWLRPVCRCAGERAGGTRVRSELEHFQTGRRASGREGERPA